MPPATDGIIPGRALVVTPGTRGVMSISPGLRLGVYDVVAPLGAGGMGEVWRARDTRLGREVALKFLPPDFAADPERHARFEREAKLLASLNHPNIAVLYGLEHLDGHHGLVMELVDGEGLDERIARGRVPVEEAIQIALQIAEALEAAHEKGIVHRDLKPANVKVRPDGTVKVLDFGLAKVWDEKVETSDPAHSPTVTGVYTRAGVILGTVAYMSPEHTRGKPVDKRTDIWAFGCLIYEMLSGRKAFDGDTVTDVIAAVVTKEPHWDALPPDVPVGVRRALRRCLEKDPRRRFRDVGDARFELEEVEPEGPDATPAAAPATAAPAAAPRRTVLPWSAAAVVFALAAGLGVGYLHPGPAPARQVRSYVLPPAKTQFVFNGATGGAVLSPDGARLVFAARDEAGNQLLWVRPLDSLTAQPLEGTEDAAFPFWSPDSRSVGFFVPGKLKKIDTFGGPPQAVCDATSGRGGTWNAAGVIVFAPDVYGGLSRVASVGGTATPLVKPDESRGQTSLRWPAFLPDGRHFVYWGGNPTASGQDTRGTYLAGLDGADQRYLGQADSNALYAPPGYLLYLRDQSLMAHLLDASSLMLRGEAFPIAEEVASPEAYRLGRFSASQDGTLAFLTGENDRYRVVWVNQGGGQGDAVGEPVLVPSIRLSPDGRTLAEQVEDPQTKNLDIWLVDLARGVKTRFTFDPSVDVGPVWSPDGARIAWSSNAKGHFDIYAKNASGAGAVETIVASKADKFVSDWSRDGRFLAFTQLDPAGKTAADVWVMPLFGDRKPYPFVATPFVEGNAVFSPDGHWLGYQSNESGRQEIYVTPFPQGGAKWQVSQAGGMTPMWRADGKVLYYRSLDGTLMDASIAANGGALEVGTPHEFATIQLPDLGATAVAYALPPKGDRFLVLRSQQNGPNPLTLVTNWTSGLRR